MKHENGFTIIEVLLVLVISSLFMAISVARYREFSQRQSVGVAQRLVISDLVAARKDAVSGRKPQGFVPVCAGDLDAYVVSFDASAGATNYTVSARCLVPSGAGTTSTQLKNKDLPEGITAALTPAGTTDVVFLPLAGGAELPVTIVLTSTDTGQSVNIIVSDNGQIE